MLDDKEKDASFARFDMTKPPCRQSPFLMPLIRGRRARIIGRICMDMCMADITKIENCVPGDEVEIFGGTVSVNELAERMGTINYELLCSVKNRVPRRYI